MDEKMASMLTRAATDVSDDDLYMARREAMLGTAVGAFCRHDEAAGSLGHGVRLGRPTDTVRHLFGVRERGA
jgi:hypothetical protein